MKDPRLATVNLVISENPEGMYVTTPHPDTVLPEKEEGLIWTMERLVLVFARYPGVEISSARHVIPVLDIEWLDKTIDTSKRQSLGPYELK